MKIYGLPNIKVLLFTSIDDMLMTPVVFRERASPHRVMPMCQRSVREDDAPQRCRVSEGMRWVTLSEVRFGEGNTKRWKGKGR